MTVTSPFSDDIVAQAELLEPPDGESLRLRFSGPFAGKTVIWDATFTTLAALVTSAGEPQTLRNFIEIGDDTGHGMALTVGLNVPCIDLPTVRKAILMVRQYKRWARERLAFGPPVTLP